MFYDLGGYDLDAADDDGPVQLVLDVITLHLEVGDIGQRLAEWAKPR